MSIANDKIVNLQDAKVLYDDLRGRIKDNAVVKVLDTPAAIQSFDNAARFPLELQASINPVQDLHGYDHPWPAGGGKNLYSGASTINKDNASIYYNVSIAPIQCPATLTFSAQITSESSGVRVAFRDANGGAIEAISVSTGSSRTSATATISSEVTIERIYLYGSTSTATAAAAKFTNIQIESGSTATSYAPYSNICPISGWDGANVTVTGKNLAEITEKTHEGITFSKDGDYLKLSGAATGNPTESIIHTISLHATRSFIFTADKISGSTQDENGIRITWRLKKNGTQVYRASNTWWDLSSRFVMAIDTLSYDADSLDILYINRNGRTISNLVIAPMLRLVTELDETYEPYTGTVYPVTFPSSAGTIYGGTLTIHSDGSGEVVVDKGFKDLGDCSYSYRSSSNRNIFSTTDIPIVKCKNTTNPINAISSMYRPVSQGATWVNGDMAYYAVNASRVDFVNNDYTTVAAFKTAMSGVHIVFDLESPITYSLTPGQVFAILGYNNVWADCGQVNYLEYVKDTVGEVIPNRFDGIEQDIVETNMYEKTISEANAIQTFEDGANWPMGMQIAIEPVQDLHGYDNPWPAGGGKNLLKLNSGGSNNSITATTVYDSDGNATGVSLTGTATALSLIYVSDFQTFPAGTYILSGCPSGGGGSTYDIRVYDTNANALCTDNASGVEFTLSEAKSIRVGTIVRSGVSVSNKLFKPMIRLASVSDSTFEPYTNVCSITGWTEANVNVMGKNLCTGIEQGAVAVNGEDTSESYANRVRTFWIPVKAGTKYTVSATGNGITPGVYIRVFNGIHKKNDPVYQSGWATLPLTFTTGQDAKFIRAIFREVNNANVTPASFSNVQIEEGTQVTEYDPSSRRYPITFSTSAGTVYGGTLSVNKDGTGTLVVDKAGVDLGSLTWEYKSNNRFNANGITNMKLSALRTQYLMCSCYKVNVGGGAYDDKTIYNGAAQDLYIVDTNYSDVTSFTASVTGQTAVYPLETSVSYSLSAPQVLSLLRKNNVWADCGDILSLTYNSKKGIEFIREDTAGQINTVVDPVKTELADAEAAMAIVVDGDTAPKNITSGQYVFVKNHSTLATGMYHATTAISSGASVTSSNVEADPDGVANALSTIKTTTGITNGTKVSSSNIESELCGRLHCIKGYFTINDSLAKEDVLFNVPDSLKPGSAKNYFVAYVTDSNKIVRLTIGSRGIIVDNLLGNTFSNGDLLAFSYYYFIH